MSGCIKMGHKLNLCFWKGLAEIVLGVKCVEQLEKFGNLDKMVKQLIDFCQFYMMCKASYQVLFIFK